jgi:hypothetical protein
MPRSLRRSRTCAVPHCRAAATVDVEMWLDGHPVACVAACQGHAPGMRPRLAYVERPRGEPAVSLAMSGQRRAAR